jgi:hypothetical protein
MSGFFYCAFYHYFNTRLLKSAIKKACPHVITPLKFDGYGIIPAGEPMIDFMGRFG